jgi:hypothetical protein
LPRIYLIQVDAALNFDAVDAYAKAHNQTYLVDASRRLTERLIRRATEIQSKGTVLDVYRYFNSEAAIRLNDSSYTYLCRIGHHYSMTAAVQIFPKVGKTACSRDQRSSPVMAKFKCLLLCLNCSNVCRFGARLTP